MIAAVSLATHIDFDVLATYPDRLLATYIDLILEAKGDNDNGE